jgi:hypothetical protein
MFPPKTCAMKKTIPVFEVGEQPVPSVPWLLAHPKKQRLLLELLVALIHFSSQIDAARDEKESCDISSIVPELWNLRTGGLSLSMDMRRGSKKISRIRRRSRFNSC